MSTPHRASSALAAWIAVALTLLWAAPREASAKPHVPARTSRARRLARRLASLESRFLPLVSIANTVGGSSNFSVRAEQHAALTQLLGPGYTKSLYGGPRSNSSIALVSADGRRRLTMKHMAYSLTFEERGRANIVKTTQLSFAYAKPDVWETTPRRTMLRSALQRYLRGSDGRQLTVTIARDNPRPGVYRANSATRQAKLQRNTPMKR